jgi:hypothetical protein
MPWLQLIPWKVIGLVALVLGIWGYGYWGGVNHERDKQIAIAAKHLEAAIQTERVRSATTLEVERMAWEKANQIKETTKTIVKVIRDEKPSATCKLSNGWVQRHNEASANSVPSTPSVNYETYSGVTADKALEAVAENYGTCYEIRNIAESCQSWIKQQLKNNKE